MAAAHPPELVGLLNATDPAAREAAWSTFVDSYSRLLLHTARAVARNPDGAMDGYAYVLEQLRRDECHRLRAYAADGRSKFSTWLVVVARRLCLDHHRQRYGRLRESGGEDGAGESRAARRRLEDLLAEALDPADLSADDASSPDAQLRARQLSEALRGVLNGLPAGDRLLVKLRFEDALPAREIASVMRFPTPFHVYRRLNALLDMLRRALRARGVEDAEP